MFDIDDMKDEEEVVTDINLEPEDTELEDEESLAKDKLKSLRDKLKHSEEERKKCQDDLQRTRADFLNSRKRLDEQLARDKERATDKLIMELLTLADSFDMAMLDRELWEKMDARLKTGIEAIQAKLSSILASNNITTISPEGAIFDPNEHEAVSNSPVTDDSDVDKIVAVLQRGYKRNNDIIRPARVVVGTK
ncbi:MAG: nucleotide exchange factor GrpE [Candidatus Kaiserbacteria bacterium]|nr:nucleotide exchange factor GrpE [Candidatus Kaiserbacteria bacterium]